MYKLMRLHRRRINSVPLGPKLHTTTSTPLVSNYQNLSSSEKVPQWGTFFLLYGGDQQYHEITFSNIFIHCLNKCPLPLGTSEGVKFIPSGDELFFRYRVTFCLFPLVTGVGFNFVSTGDEVRTLKKLHIFRKKGVRFSAETVR